MNVAAELLRYPDDALCTLQVPEFHDEIAHVTLEGLQELYTLTFDLNPVATLEVGWHLWGEQYERGRFLADLRAKQDLLGIDAGDELPDHLPVVLQMLDRQFDPELAKQVLRAMTKIATPLDEQGNPYRHVIHAATKEVERQASACRSEQEPRP